MSWIISHAISAVKSETPQLRMSDCRTRQTHARAIWSAFHGIRALAAVVRYEVHQKVRYAVNVSCKSCADAPYLNCG